MGDDKNNNITQIAFRKVIQNKKLTDEEAIALENSWRENSRVRKLAVKVVKSWKAWIIAFIAGGATFRDSIETVFVNITK